MNAVPATPYLALDMNAFEHNARQLASTIVRDGGKRWRPHVKSIRSAALALQLQQFGARGVTCATAGEAAAMVVGGINDVLIASQVVQPVDLELVARLNLDATVMVSVDAAAQLQPLAAAGERAGSMVPVVIEVDVGLCRAGVDSAEDALALLKTLQLFPALHYRGLMAWEGHTTRVEAGAPRRAAVELAVGKLCQVARHCAAAGHPSDIISCGGTGTFEMTSTLEGPTEIQAGGGVFGDLRCRETFGVPMQAALTLVATVLSRPTPRRIVCDAGWKSLAVYPTAPRMRHQHPVQSLTHAAEHLTIELLAPSDQPAIGERVSFEVGYADATTFLHRTLYGQRGGQTEAVFDLVAAHPGQVRHESLPLDHHRRNQHG